LSGVRQGLADVGLVEGRNLVIERRYADSHPERVNELAMELVPFSWPLGRSSRAQRGLPPERYQLFQ
jgi:hypothetical protein